MLSAVVHTAVKVVIIIGIIIGVIVAAGAALLYAVVSEIEEQMGIGISNEELDMIALRDVSHAELVENNDSYVGQVVKGTGQIVGIEELPLDGLAYLIDTGNDEYYLLYDDRVRHGETGYALFYGGIIYMSTQYPCLLLALLQPPRRLALAPCLGNAREQSRADVSRLWTTFPAALPPWLPPWRQCYARH